MRASSWIHTGLLALLALASPLLQAQADPELRAQLTPRRYTTLAAEIGARIQRLPVTEGGEIRAGDLLIGFDCSLQQAQRQRGQAALDEQAVPAATVLVGQEHGAA